jgi:hypothetical protein
MRTAYVARASFPDIGTTVHDSALVDHGVMTGVQKFIKVQADLSVTDGQLVVLIIGATPESVTLVAG